MLKPSPVWKSTSDKTIMTNTMRSSPRCSWGLRQQIAPHSCSPWYLASNCPAITATEERLNVTPPPEEEDNQNQDAGVLIQAIHRDAWIYWNLIVDNRKRIDSNIWINKQVYGLILNQIIRPCIIRVIFRTTSPYYELNSWIQFIILCEFQINNQHEFISTSN
jgi:hypothetical protein